MSTQDFIKDTEKTAHLKDWLEKSHDILGTQSFDQHLTELFQRQIIDVSEAKRLATNVDALNLALRGISNSDTRLR